MSDPAAGVLQLSVAGAEVQDAVAALHGRDVLFQLRRFVLVAGFPVVFAPGEGTDGDEGGASPGLLVWTGPAVSRLSQRRGIPAGRPSEAGGRFTGQSWKSS
ncbi:hypothetical protein SSCG_02159 [Streptomyces clavuligerus]|nr:hypothetical protein SSCG_02159 [Streptomyces clavuligerus]